MKFNILFRVDAGEKIGLGHLRRCLALAEGFRTRGVKRIGFLTRTRPDISPWIKRRFSILELKARSFSEEARELEVLLALLNPKMLIVDHYGVDSKFLERVRSLVPALLYMDDEARMRHYPVDGIINHNVYAKKLKYRALPDTRLFLGPRYTLIGSEFFKARRKAVIASPAGAKQSRRSLRRSAPRDDVRLKLFVSLGGYVPKASFGKIKKALQISNGRLKVFWAGGRKPVGKEMASSDLALSASGVTSYELAYLGVPALLTTVAKNQEGIAEELARRGTAENLGRLKRLTPRGIIRRINALIQSPKKLQGMRRKAKALIDGRGAFRLAEDLMKTYWSAE